MLRRARFVSLFCFVGGGRVPFLKFHFWECINKVLRMTSLHKVSFKCGNGPFSSNVFFFEEFVLRNLSLLSVGDTFLACKQALRATWAVNEVRFIFEIRFCCCVLLWSSCVRETRSLTQSLSQKPTKTWEQKNSGIGLDWRASFDQVMLLLTRLLTSLQLDYC